jgi:diguanylate cyclase (GGDEF)-like protein
MSDKPIDHCPNGQPCKLNTELEQLKQELHHLSELVSTDPLTHLFNYRHFTHELDQEIERSQRSLQSTSLIMLDVDHFKRVNDQWGHETGNLALKLIARCIMQNIRKLDIACRYGGEEFAIILPSSEIPSSVRVAERIRESIENTPLVITHPDGKIEEIHLTASAGLSMYTGSQPLTSQQIIESADAQLYLAKSQGRNRVCFTTPDDSANQVTKDEKSALFTLFNDDD